MSLKDLRRKLARNRREQRQVAAAEEAGGGGERLAAGSSPAGAVLVQPALEARQEIPELSDEERAELGKLNPLHRERLSRLNPFQIRAIMHRGSSLVTAQVGSGKTTVLVEKAVHLINSGVDPARMTIFTFTRKAAHEIHERLHEALAQVQTGASAIPATGTFHSLAHSLLLSHPDPKLERWRAGLTVLDDKGRLELLQDLAEREKLRVLYQKKLSRRIDLFRSGNPLFGNMKKEDDLGRLLELYDEAKQAGNVVDFDDLIRFGQAAAASLDDSERPEWILVDEFQDTDKDQLALLQNWAAPTTRVFAVGDPDQVIYSWRSSGADVFASFEETFGAEALELGINYRSSANILEAARFVLSISRRGSDPRPTRDEGALVTIREHHNPVTEACYLADCMKGLQGNETAAVLVRTRQQLETLQEQMRLAGVDAIVLDRFEDELGLREFAHSYFHWLAGESADWRSAEWLCHPEFGFGALRGRSQDFSQAQDDLSALLKTAGNVETSQSAWLRQSLSSRWSEFRTNSDFSDARTLVEKSGILDYLLPMSSKAAALERKLLSCLEGVLGDGPQTPEAALGSAKAALAADSKKLSPLGGIGGQVQLLTMHASKGLEFDRVYISGANRGLMPLSSSWSDDEKEAEERRLMFVAMTRARDYLEIGWFKNPGGERILAEPSPYLNLIPESLLAPENSPVETGNVPEPEKKTGGWELGDDVSHARYGAGEVVALDDKTVTVEFSKGRRKPFPLQLCPLKRR